MGRWAALSPLTRCRAALGAVIFVATCTKLALADRTFGTEDVQRWQLFAAGVRRAGPVGVYRLHFPTVNGYQTSYNHPPLIGYMLELVNVATRHGLSFPLVIRIPAIAADIAATFLVFEMVRRRRSQRTAFAAAVSVALSPVLLAISGYHGQTDPVVIMFALLSVHLLVDRRAPVLAGVALAIALGIKIVPVVIVPTLLAFAVRAGRRVLLRFVLASGAVLALTWAPAILRAWQPFRENVLGYSGGGGAWGLSQLGLWAGSHGWVHEFRGGTGRFVVVLAVTALPAALAFWRPRFAGEASALALCGLLLLSPRFAKQYLVWAVVPAYLLSFWPALLFNLLAGALLIEIYNSESGGYPWYKAVLTTPLTTAERVALLGVWLALLSAVVAGIWHTVRPRPEPLRDTTRVPPLGVASQAAAVPPGE